MTLWLGFFFSKSLYNYIRLSGAVVAQEISWQAVPLEGSKFGVEAAYTYEVGGKGYSQKYVYRSPRFPSEYAAKAALQEWKETSWTVYYDKSKPEISAMQRFFPYKLVIRFGLSAAVLLYFAWLYESIGKGSSSPRPPTLKK